MLELLLNDADLVAVNKPAALATIPGRAETTSVLEEVAAQLGIPSTGTADPRVRVVHRLDKDTSGVLLFAKHAAAQRHISHQFQNNTIEKEYLAIVTGKAPQDSGDIDAPLAPHPTQKDRMHVSKHGRPARSLWQVEQRFRQYTLLRVFPKTGKTHQIRVHLKSINLPLAIDPLYNSLPPGKDPALYLSSFKRGYQPSGSGDERPLISRLTLHAHRLTFNHPDGRRVTIEAPLPKDLRAAINQLTRHGSR
jgi:23S rRNA pseudouridine955/2504/2580 synthase/23S rRNA pseudouridine1911/1915/1917 synthase